MRQFKSFVICFLQIIAFSVNEVLSQDQDYKEFWDACAFGDMDIIQKYVDADKSIAKKSTIDGETCLHLTAISNSLEIATLMVELGADVNSRVTHSEGLRMTPLSWHTYSGNYPIIKLLLDNGAEINADFDAKQGEDIKYTIMDVAEGLVGQQAADEQNNEDKFMRSFLEIEKRGGVKYAEL